MKNLINIRMGVLMIAAVGFMHSATGAFALAITNMADIPYDLEMKVAGVEQTVAIDAGRTWRTNENPVIVKVRGENIRLEAGSEYTIWKDGTFAQQNRNRLDQ